jgi:hypothetical protein
MNVAIPDSVISIGNGAFHGVGNIMYSGAATGAPWDAKNLNGNWEKAKEEERRKLVEKRKQEIEQTKKENKRIIIIIIIAILGLVMLINAKCAKTRSNHHYDLFDPSMEYRHT